MPSSFSFTLIPTTLTPAEEAAQPFGTLAGAEAFRDWALNPSTGDIYLGDDGDLVGVAGADGVASDIGSRLRTFRAECFLDLSLGMPYFEEIFGRTTLARNEQLYRQEILSTPGAGDLESISVSKAGRQLKVDFEVTTDFPEIIQATLNLET